MTTPSAHPEVFRIGDIELSMSFLLLFLLARLNMLLLMVIPS